MIMGNQMESIDIWDMFSLARDMQRHGIVGFGLYQGPMEDAGGVWSQVERECGPGGNLYSESDCYTTVSRIVKVSGELFGVEKVYWWLEVRVLFFGNRWKMLAWEKWWDEYIRKVQQ